MNKTKILECQKHTLKNKLLLILLGNKFDYIMVFEYIIKTIGNLGLDSKPNYGILRI